MFISKKIIGVTFLGLLIYLTIDFFQKKEENFWQFNYNWAEIETIQELGKVGLDSVHVNYLEISTNKNVSTEDVHTIALGEGANKSYFNFENAYVSNQKIKFTGGFWVLNNPVKQRKNIEAELINLPLKQTGDLKINIITDSQLLWRGGRNFRKWLKEKNNNLYFVGNQIDLYGFPYNGEIVNTTEKTLNNRSDIPKADLYVISLGTHESQRTIQESVKNYKKLMKELQQKNNSATIFIVNAPPSLDKRRNTYNKKLNKALATIANAEQVQIIDFYQLVENNYKNLLAQDQIHYQSEAYKMLVNHINKQIHGVK